MNCTVCGHPLLFDRVVFHCSCSAYVHAYCWKEHVLEAHQPSYEIGSVDLDGNFKERERKLIELNAEEKITEEQPSEDNILEEQTIKDLSL